MGEVLLIFILFTKKINLFKHLAVYLFGLQLRRSGLFVDSQKEIKY